MEHLFLNKIILDIADPEVRENFLSCCPEEIKSRIIRYSEDLFRFSDSLYLSDSTTGCRKLMSKGFPVAAIMHENNSNQDFSSVRYVIEQPELVSLEDYEHIFRRVSGIPLDILETKRLLIRETILEDLDAFYDLYDDPEVKCFMEPLFDPEEEKKYQLNYIENIYRFYDIGIWSVILRETGEIIGRIGIEYTDEPGVAELGFMIGADHRKKGYAFEACSAIIEYARGIDSVNTVRTRVRHDNTASAALCRKLGLIPVKELENDLEEWVIRL